MAGWRVVCCAEAKEEEFVYRECLASLASQALARTGLTSSQQALSLAG